MCFLTERQQRVLRGLKQLGIIEYGDKITDNEDSLFTLEDVLSLYRERRDSGNIFKKNGELSLWGQKAYQRLYQELCVINQLLPEGKRIDVDRAESEVDRIIQLGT
ncbi:hypothetical protein VSQ48_20055 [Candidatus Ventrimonas sp. KK005]